VDDQNYLNILDSMQETGVYVIREDNHQLLYLNRRVRSIAPNARVGMVCRQLWPENCWSCPLPVIGDRQESRSVCYDSPFGPAVDFVASRILWDGSVPAFSITMTPHAEASGYIYQHLLRANLTQNTCEPLQTVSDAAWSGMDTLTGWAERFLACGSLHPEDVARVRAFVRLNHLRDGLRAGKNVLSCIYRLRVGDSFRWHLLEVVPEFRYADGDQWVLLCIKDVHDTLREGLAREESSFHHQEIIRALGEQNFSIYVVDLDDGTADPVRVEGRMQPLEGRQLMNWERDLLPAIRDQLYWEYREELMQTFSLESLRRTRDAGESRLELLCQRTSDGETCRYVSVNACFNPERDRTRYAVLAMQDVDDRIRQELAHSKWNMQMAAILKCRYSVMNTVHLDTGLYERIDLNRADSPMDAHPEDYAQHVLHALDRIVREEDAERFRHTMSLDHIRRRAMEIGNYDEEVCEYRTRDNPPRWLEQHVVYSRQPDEVLVNILSRDITGEKSREEAHQERDREQLDIIRSLSSMFFATYYVNLEEDTLRGVTQLREVAELLEGESRYTASIRAYAEKFIHPDDRETYLSTMSVENLRGQLGPDRTFLSFEYRKLPANEGEAEPDQCGWVRCTAVLVRSDGMGRPYTALYAAQDVTEEKQKEVREHHALLEACQAASHANAAKSEFLSRMSHDIRTPMNGIIGMTNIAIANVGNQDRVLDCLNKISISSRHLLNLVNEVLDMSQIESGKIHLVEEQFSIPEMIRELAVIVRPSVQEKGHELRIHPLEVEHAAVIGDPSHLRQVFVNILGNSVKYTPPGGLLEIEVREKETRKRGVAYYDFVFRDNGIGMDEAFVSRIFEPYSRAEDSRISAIEGTGLGMTIAQNIVRMMGGSIAVKSQLGKGTQFTVTLFLRQQEESAAAGMEEPEEMSVSLWGRKILLAEDNDINREIACDILQGAGAEIDCVENGREAVERFAIAPPGYYDLILMDIQMPVMNGHEATRAIRSLTYPDGSAIPIIAMSANAFAEDISASRESGMNDHVTKPLDVPRLMQCLRTWLKPRDEEES